MQTYEILVKERSVLPNSADMSLVQGSIGIDEAHFLFDNDEWLDFPISATFKNGTAKKTASLTISEITGGGEWVAEATCDIPWEVIQSVGKINVTLQGTDSGGNHIITGASGNDLLTVDPCGDTASGEVPSGAPTQSEWEQAYADAMEAVNALSTKLEQCDAAIAAMSAYTPSTATSSTLGIVKPDNTTITIDGNGVLTASDYDLPIAESNVLGGVQVSGDTIEIDEYGTIDVASALVAIMTASGAINTLAFDLTTEDDAITAAVLKASSLPSAAYEVVEGYLYNGAFYDDSEHTTAITGASGKLYVDISTNYVYRYANSAYTQVATYSLPTAASNTLGGVKVGSGLAIDANGVLSLDVADGDSTSY